MKHLNANSTAILLGIYIDYPTMNVEGTFTQNLRNSEDGIYYLGDYHPYRLNDERNKAFDAYSGSILDLKERQPRGIDFFHDRLDRLIPEGTILVTVPSHDPASSESGITILARRLSETGRVDATSCLKRITQIEKLTHGGDRSINTHLGSIRVQETDLFKGKTVVLLDDVTTTGNSLLACKNLLIQAGAREVIPLALGKTKWE